MLTQTAIDKALTERPWVTKIDETCYRVVPRRLMDAINREHGKGDTMVTQRDLVQDTHQWINMPGPDIRYPNDLDEILHTLSELGMWPDDVDSVSTAQAMLCWQVIERLRKESLPPDLKL